MQQIREVLQKLHVGGFPSAIVAGGAIRDLIFGKPVKDIDVFVSFEESQHYEYRTWELLQDALGLPVQAENWGSYMSVPDVYGVFTVLGTRKDELPVQIIVMEQGLNPITRVDQLDFGFCQVWTDGNALGAAGTTPAFFKDAKDKTITLVYCESQHEFDRSMIRYERLKQKYPEFKLVIPEPYLKYKPLTSEELLGELLDYRP